MVKLEMINISKSFFGVQVLHNVSLKVHKGTVHALIGENGAGKSTLMNVLGGVHQPDSGIIKIDGKETGTLNVNASEKLGVAFVHQEINLFNDLKVYENIFITKEITKFGCINAKKMIEMSNNLFKQLGVDIDANELVANLSTGKKQLLEISKALFANADLFILDEPTTALSNEEIDHFFNIINNLKKQGKTFIFISHKMPEIFKLCDEYTVLRNGYYISSGKISETTPEQVTKDIVGPGYDSTDYYKRRKLGEVVLDLVNFSGPGFKNINLKIRKGEIVGFTGLQGSGSSELMQTLFGVNRSSGGDVIAFDKQITNKSIKKVMRNKVGMVPSNRKENSVFESLSILDNTSVASNNVNKNPIFSPRKERKLYEIYKKQLNIKASSSNDLLVSLSGGNQQKVIIGRWLKTNADILLLDNPTQGIDVGAKTEIYKLLLELASQGKTIIFNTLEVPEIMKCADRCCVFYHGTIEKILDHDEVNEERVMYYATSANKAEVGANV